VGCKGKESPSKRRDRNGIPLLQFDYCFAQTELPGDEMVTVLAGVDMDTSYGMSVVVTNKGPIKESIQAVLAFIQECGYIGAKIELQSDSEPAIKKLLEEVAKARPNGMTNLRCSPPGHHQSNGGVERWIQTAVGQSRCFRASLKKHMGKDILGNSPWGSLAFRHASWIYNRTHLRPDGRSPWEVVHEKPYANRIFEFGELVMGKPFQKDPAKLEEKFVPGVWVGKRIDDDNHVLVTENGIIYARSVRAPATLDKSLYDRVTFTARRQQVALSRDEPLEDQRASTKKPSAHPDSIRIRGFWDGAGRSSLSTRNKRQEAHTEVQGATTTLVCRPRRAGPGAPTG
jgi:hypothetical protein